MIQNCPMCGKAFDVLWPHQWAYKRGGQFLCSWGCLRKNEKGVKEMSGRAKVPEEEKKAAIEAAISGGDPFEFLQPYSKNPKKLWAYMKQQLKEKDPEIYAKIPDLRNRKKEEPAEEKPEKPKPEKKTVTVTKVEEVPNIIQPVVYNGMTVREIEGGFGRYRRSDVHGSIYIDFEYTEGADVISLTVEQWRRFLEELDNAAKILGVSL